MAQIRPLDTHQRALSGGKIAKMTLGPGLPKSCLIDPEMHQGVGHRGPQSNYPEGELGAAAPAPTTIGTMRGRDMTPAESRFRGAPLPAWCLRAGTGYDVARLSQAVHNNVSCLRGDSRVGRMHDQRGAGGFRACPAT